MTSQAEQFNQRNIDEFRTNHGRVGGTFAGAPLMLLHTVGARSGQQRINPMMYLADGDNYLVFASKAGSDSNPDWYWNLRATPDVTIEVGDETIAVRATELPAPNATRSTGSSPSATRDSPGTSRRPAGRSRSSRSPAGTTRHPTYTSESQGAVRPLRAGGRPACRRCPASLGRRWAGRGHG